MPKRSIRGICGVMGSPMMVFVLIAGLVASIGFAQVESPATQPDIVGRLREYLNPSTMDVETLEGQIVQHFAGDFESLRSTAFSALESFRTLPPGRRELQIESPPGGPKHRVLVFVPGVDDPRVPLPLVVTLHQAGGRAEDPFEFMQPYAEKHRFLLAALDGNARGPDRGWGYTFEERLAHTDLLRHLKFEFNIDADRVFLHGYSRGGHGALDLALTSPHLFAGGVVASGSLRHRDIPLATNLSFGSWRVFVGARDQSELVEGARLAAARLASLKSDAIFRVLSERGHEWFEDLVPDALSETLLRRREAIPHRLQYRTWDPQLRRAYWVRVSDYADSVYKPGAPINIAGSSQMTVEERQRAYVAAIEKKTAEVTGDYSEPGKFEVKTRHIRRLEILIPASGIDFEKKLTVVANSRTVHSKVFSPSPAIFLRSLRETLDPRLSFAALITLSL